MSNLLIGLSLVGFVITFLPYFLLSLPQDDRAILSAQFSIRIPKIQAASPIVLDVDPWDASIYKDALQYGIAHAKGTARPGDKGTMFLFAHSSGMPWELTRTNTPFLKLGELTKGDQIELLMNEQVLTYAVTEKKVVSPGDISYITEASDDQLILQTCWPLGTDWKRLLVFAKPVSASGAQSSNTPS